MYTAIIVFCKHAGSLHGAGETAGHGDMYDLVVVFEQLVPEGSDGFRCGLGCGNSAAWILFKMLKEF